MARNAPGVVTGGAHVPTAARMTRGDDLRLFSGSTHPALFHAVCAYLESAPGELDVHRFGNENVFARFREDVSGRDVFLLQAFHFPVNASIMELLVMADAARRASAGRITAVIPYYAYGRSDSQFDLQVPITARLMADLITVAGVDRVVTIDMHATQIQGFFTIPVDELTALDLLATHFRDGTSDRVVVAPHEGSTRWAKGLAERLDLPLAILEKRSSGTGSGSVEQLNILGDVDGRSVILVENEIDTGGSLARAAQRVVTGGATRVSAAATHAVLSNGAAERLDRAPIDEVVVTDSLPVPRAVKAKLAIESVSVAPLIGAAIRRIHEGRPLGRLSATAGRQ